MGKGRLWGIVGYAVQLLKLTCGDWFGLMETGKKGADVSVCTHTDTLGRACMTQLL